MASDAGFEAELADEVTDEDLGAADDETGPADDSNQEDGPDDLAEAAVTGVRADAAEVSAADGNIPTAGDGNDATGTGEADPDTEAAEANAADVTATAAADGPAGGQATEPAPAGRAATGQNHLERASMSC